MKKIISKCVFGFGFDRATQSTGNAGVADGAGYYDDMTITATQRYRHDIRDAVREIYSQATT